MENLQAHHEPLYAEHIQNSSLQPACKICKHIVEHLFQSLFHTSHASRAGESEERTSSRDLLSSLEVRLEKSQSPQNKALNDAFPGSLTSPPTTS